MADLVDPNKIEKIVGAPRHATLHLARADTRNAMVYILHSQECKDSGIDLRACAYSVALDHGIEEGYWEEHHMDRPVVVRIVRHRLAASLIPAGE